MFGKIYPIHYSYFVNGYGGIECLEKKTNEFTRGYHPVKHLILIKNAIKTRDSLETKKVTSDESDALTYAFIKFMKEQVE